MFFPRTFLTNYCDQLKIAKDVELCFHACSIWLSQILLLQIGLENTKFDYNGITFFLFYSIKFSFTKMEHN